jgi:hypothetical protein
VRPQRERLTDEILYSELSPREHKCNNDSLETFLGVLLFMSSCAIGKTKYLPVLAASGPSIPDELTVWIFPGFQFPLAAPI